MMNIYRTKPEEPMLDNLIRENKPRLVVDIGSGSGDYIVNSARENPDKEFVAIDLDYGPGQELKKEKNVNRIKADARYLPLRSECSDLTAELGCSKMVISSNKNEDKYKIFEEMHRITKQNGIGVNGPLDEKIGLLPSDPSYRRRLKDLANEAIRVGGKKNENGKSWHVILPPKKEFLEIRNVIKGILDVPTEELLRSFGLETFEKVPSPSSMVEPTYFYTWRRAEPEELKGKRIVRTDYSYLEDLIKDMQEIDV